MLGTLDLNVGTVNEKLISIKGKPLSKHVHKEPASGDVDYSSVVGMILYLACHTCPDISYAVDCAAQCMLYTILVYEHALKQIGCYLKTASDKGLIMNPSLMIFLIQILLEYTGRKEWMILIM